MTVFDKMDTSYKPWKMYHGKKDMLDATHSIVDMKKSFPLYPLAIEMPEDEKLFQMEIWMEKEIDTATRFSLSDGNIQIEIEVWDGDFEKRLYFACDLTLRQCIRMIKSKNFFMGFCPVGLPQLTVAAVKMFQRDDLISMIKTKQMIDAHIKRPKRWKVG